MEHGFDQQYDNVWDAPRSAPSSRAFFAPPAQYGHIPKITHQNYDQVTQYSPDAQKIKPVFPWEANLRQNAPSRVFPQEAQPRRTPSPQNQPPPQPQMSSSAPATTGGFNTAGLASKYSNAWDNVASIKRYADNLQGKPRLGQGQHGRAHSYNAAAGSSHMPSHARTGSTASYYSGSRGGNQTSPRKEGYETGGEASSRDGDDEDEDDEDYEGDSGYARRNAASKGRQAAAPSNGRNAPGGNGTNRSPPQGQRTGPVASRAIPPPHFARPAGVKRNDSYQNMANLTANVAAAGPVGASPLSPAISPTGLLVAGSGKSAPPLNRYASQRTSSSETVTPTSAAGSANGRIGGLPNPSNGEYKSQRVSRVFDPATATDVIREEGLNALHRFVRNMEARGADVRNGQSQQDNGNGNGSAAR